MDKIRDINYEIQISKHFDRNIDILNNVLKTFKENEVEKLMVTERWLQILIEWIIWFSRYFLNIKYWIKSEKSRDAIDILFQKWDLKSDEYDDLLKMIWYRNILVHDYLDSDYRVTEQILMEKKFLVIWEIFKKLKIGITD